MLLPTSLRASLEHLAGSWNPTPREVATYLLSLWAMIKCSICNSYSAYTLRLLNASCIRCMWKVHWNSMARRDFREQKDAKKKQKARLSETEREGLHASIVVGKARRAQKVSRWSSIEGERVAKARQHWNSMAWRDFSDQNDARKASKTRLSETKKESLRASIVVGNTYAAWQSQRYNMHVQSEGVQGTGGGAVS